MTLKRKDSNPYPYDYRIKYEHNLFLLNLEQKLGGLRKSMGGLVAIEIVGKSAHIQQDNRMPAYQYQITNIGDPTIQCQDYQHEQGTHQQLHL